MAVQRTSANHQTTYELRDDSGVSCVLTYTAAVDAAPPPPSAWRSRNHPG
jgi:hypothetical protein